MKGTDNGRTFDFNDLFVFEMANNHQGKIDHGKRIISEMGRIAKERNIRGVMKFQFRNLDTFVHPDQLGNKENKHVQRFLSTRLSDEQFAELIDETHRRNLSAMVTPFDEDSVDLIERLGADIVKVASCSALDWPLLERIAETGKPVIASTGGLSIAEIDRVVSFFQHRGVHFALMHCVAVYPTPCEKLHLNQIELLRNRYPELVVGFSTHEKPDDPNVIRVAYAKGARIFEKHVGIPTAEIVLNAYSANPKQIEAWLDSYKESVMSCGISIDAAMHTGRPITTEEKKDLFLLKRGVFAKTPLRKGGEIRRKDVFFAFPIQDGQLSSGEFKDGTLADKDYEAKEAVSAGIISGGRLKRDIIYSTVRAVRGMLNNARIPVGHEFRVELSHHYGISRFGEIGCVIIECINQEYAKKLIIQLPGQWNPVHYHKGKDETFQMLFGQLEVEIEGRKKVLFPGDTLWVPRGVWHGFGTTIGAIFEEVSTTSRGGDSFYIDRKIANMNRDGRKTTLMNWGRHQFDDDNERV
ncbi:MAG: N-acetylneuraminate synthase family protein [Candidatus Vogelbacteria bacterium]|nr:N-acetylneuraminate synthase family protein [Candidatus Vogelbacteria bacterium]